MVVAIIILFVFSALVDLCLGGRGSVGGSGGRGHGCVPLVGGQLRLAADPCVRRRVRGLPGPPPDPVDHHVQILRQQRVQDRAGHDSRSAPGGRRADESLREVVLHALHQLVDDLSGTAQVRAHAARSHSQDSQDPAGTYRMLRWHVMAS